MQNIFWNRGKQKKTRKISIEKYEQGVRPKSLLEALRIFILGVACGMINGDHKNKDKKRSMLIHPLQVEQFIKNIKIGLRV